MNGTLSEHPPGAPEDWTLATCPLSLGRAVNKHCSATAEGLLGSRAAGGGRGPAEGTLSPLGPSAHAFANHLAAQAPVGPGCPRSPGEVRVETHNDFFCS